VVNVRPRPLTPFKETQYPFYRRLGGPQSQSWRVRKISFDRHSIPGSSYGQCKRTIMGFSLNITESREEAI